MAPSRSTLSLLAVLTLTSFAPDLASASPASSVRQFVIDARLPYDACATTASVRCITAVPSGRSACPECQQWERRFVDHQAELKFDESAYAHDTGIGIPRANHFVHDAAEAVYGHGIGRSADGAPVTMAELHGEAEELGWVELPPDVPKTGALAVWSHVGGIVIDDVSESGTDLARIRVLYPSSKLNGRLRVLEARWVGGGRTPRFLVPRSFVEEHAAPPAAGSDVRASR